MFLIVVADESQSAAKFDIKFYFKDIDGQAILAEQFKEQEAINKEIAKEKERLRLIALEEERIQDRNREELLALTNGTSLEGIDRITIDNRLGN